MSVTSFQSENKAKLSLFKHYATKAFVEVEVQIHAS